jgi:hypothetical protein
LPLLKKLRPVHVPPKQRVWDLGEPVTVLVLWDNSLVSLAGRNLVAWAQGMVPKPQV